MHSGQKARASPATPPPVLRFRQQTWISPDEKRRLRVIGAERDASLADLFRESIDDLVEHYAHGGAAATRRRRSSDDTVNLQAMIDIEARNALGRIALKQRCPMADLNREAVTSCLRKYEKHKGKAA